MNFCYCGFIFILFLKILASQAQNTKDDVPNVEIFEIEIKLHLWGLNFKLEFWDENVPNRPQCKRLSYVLTTTLFMMPLELYDEIHIKF